MTKMPEHSPELSSAPSTNNGTTASLLDVLTPDDLPALQLSHPDDFAEEAAPPETQA